MSAHVFKSNFKVNDIVKINSRTSEYHGRKGHITRIFTNTDQIEVVFPANGEWPEKARFSPEELSKKWW